MLLLVALLACAAAFGEGETVISNDDERLRRSYVEHWERLSERGTSGLERFAETVQLVVDTRAQMHRGSQDAAVRAILDDLVDVFVSASYHLEKSLVMSGPPLLGESAVEEEDEDLEGFAPLFQKGEGRFRHFALNAAAAFALPETLVDLAARMRGGDLQDSSGGYTGDQTADIATNRIGREFARLLREEPLTELTGGAVRDWILDRFGP